MLEVHFLIDAPQEWIKAISQDQSAFVKITDIKGREGSPDTVEDFVDISSAEINSVDLINTISDSKDIKNTDLVQLDQHRIKGMVTALDCPVCSTLAGLSCSLISASTVENHKMEWKVLISGEDTLKKITDKLTSKGVEYKITELSHLSTKNLTTRQEQIARIALELGYFEFPKKIGLEDLSRRLGMSAGNLSEILRRAEKNILSKYFEEHQHG